MDWKTFIVEIVSAIVWPALILLLVFNLKDNVFSILPRLKKLKLKDAEVELFEEKLNKLEVESTETNLSLTDSENDSDLDEQYEFLFQLSEVSPRAAVLESYRTLESASVKSLKNNYPHLKSKKGFSAHNMLQDSGVLDSTQYKRYMELKELRNQAAHMDDFELQNMPVNAYIDTALALAKKIEAELP